VYKSAYACHIVAGLNHQPHRVGHQTETLDLDAESKLPLLQLIQVSDSRQPERKLLYDYAHAARYGVAFPAI